MPLHLIKLCVGVETPADLRARRAQRAAQGHSAVVTTRHTPKRADEILGGGALYWVIKGQIRLRQRILTIETVTVEGRKRCLIGLDDILIDTVPQPRRPFQGWRYLEAQAAPPDQAQGEHDTPMSPDLALRLRDVGVW